MKKALIAIGIGKTTDDLEPLRGATDDARSIAAWAATQDFDTTLLIDEDQPVRAGDVFDAVMKYVETNTYSQLVVYFSGHGILKSPECELWLMSGAPRNPNEVINVISSCMNARSCGMKHVVFISDACRSQPETQKLHYLGAGCTIFPFIDFQRERPDLDVYYATLPGNPALEAPNPEDSKRNGGIFTRCMLNALEGNVGDVLHDLNIEGALSRVVHGVPLKVWLATAVPQAASAHSIVLRQEPDIRIESRPESYLARFAPNHAPSAPYAHVSRETSTLADSREIRRRLLPSRGRVLQHATPNQVNSALADCMTASWGALALSSDIDLAVIGGMPKNVVCVEGELNLRSAGDMVVGNFSPSGSHEWRQHSAFLRFGTGQLVPLSLYAGYITTVAFDGDLVLSINYVAKSNGLPKTLDFVGDAELNVMRLDFCSLARAGRLSSTSPPVIAFLKDPVKFQRADPVFAAFVAYALARAGRQAEWNLIAEQLHTVGTVLPLDALLFSELRDSNNSEQSQALLTPLLTEGWMLLDTFGRKVSGQAEFLRHHLVSSLWATISVAGARLMGL